MKANGFRIEDPDKPTQLQPTDLPQRSPKHMMEKRQPLQHMLLEKTGYSHVED
jgi:hypothetical protein